MSGEVLPDDLAVHRIGGGSADNLALKPSEATLVPPGISVLSGGTPAEAAETMRRRFPRMAPRGQTTVGSSTVTQIRQAGFAIMKDASRHFPQHARLIHPDGAAGFTEENRAQLARCFENHSGL